MSTKPEGRLSQEEVTAPESAKVLLFTTPTWKQTSYCLEKMSFGLIKQTFYRMTIMTVAMFGRKRGRLARLRTPSQTLSTWMASAGVGALDAGETGWGYIEATSQNVGQGVDSCSQMRLPNGQ